MISKQRGPNPIKGHWSILNSAYVTMQKTINTIREERASHGGELKREHERVYRRVRNLSEQMLKRLWVLKKELGKK